MTEPIEKAGHLESAMVQYYRKGLGVFHVYDTITDTLKYNNVSYAVVMRHLKLLGYATTYVRLSGKLRLRLKKDVE